MTAHTTQQACSRGSSSCWSLLAMSLPQARAPWAAAPKMHAADSLLYDIERSGPGIAAIASPRGLGTPGTPARAALAPLPLDRRSPAAIRLIPALGRATARRRMGRLCRNMAKKQGTRGWGEEKTWLLAAACSPSPPAPPTPRAPACWAPCWPSSCAAAPYIALDGAIMHCRPLKDGPLATMADGGSRGKPPYPSVHRGHNDDEGARAAARAGHVWGQIWVRGKEVPNAPCE